MGREFSFSGIKTIIYCWHYNCDNVSSLFWWSAMHPLPFTYLASVFVSGNQHDVCWFHFNSICSSKWKSLQLNAPYGGHIAPPHVDYQVERDVCCKTTSLCHLFYERRPSVGCDGYQPPSLGLYVALRANWSVVDLVKLSVLPPEFLKHADRSHMISESKWD